MVTALRSRVFGSSIEEMAIAISDACKKAYADQNLAKDIAEAADATIKLVETLI